MRALRSLFLAAALLLALGAFLALMFLPWSMEHYSGEPEDTWVLAFWAATLGSSAAISLVIVWAIGRRLRGLRD
jgi:hypothetical protein